MSLKGLLHHQYMYHTYGAAFSKDDQEFSYSTDNRAKWTLERLLMDHEWNHETKYFRGKPHTHNWMK